MTELFGTLSGFFIITVIIFVLFIVITIICFGTAFGYHGDGESRTLWAQFLMAWNLFKPKQNENHSFDEKLFRLMTFQTTRSLDIESRQYNKAYREKMQVITYIVDPINKCYKMYCVIGWASLGKADKCIFFEIIWHVWPINHVRIFLTNQSSKS